MNPSSTTATSTATTMTSDSPIRPLAPPTKKLRSIHSSTSSDSSRTRSSSQNHPANRGSDPPPSSRSGSMRGGTTAATTTSRSSSGSVISVEHEEGIAKRRAELRKLQEKRSGRLVMNVMAPNAATAAAIGGLLSNQQQQPSDGSNSPGTGTQQQQQQPQRPLVPSPNQVARVHHSDIFPNVNKSVSSRGRGVKDASKQHLKEPQVAVMPSFPNLAATAAAVVNPVGGPEPRRLEAVFDKDKNNDAAIAAKENKDNDYEQEPQEPLPVMSPPPEKSLRSKSAPPGRPPVPSAIPPVPVAAAGAPQATTAHRSFTSRPDPIAANSDDNSNYNRATAAATTSTLSSLASSSSSPQQLQSSPRSAATARQDLLRSFHMYDEVNLIQVLAQQKKECGEAKRKIARLEDQLVKLTKERIVPRDLETFLVKIKDEGGEPALRWARDRFPESFAQVSMSDWPVALFENIGSGMGGSPNLLTSAPASPRRVLSFSALSPTSASGANSSSSSSGTTNHKRLRASTPYPKLLLYKQHHQQQQQQQSIPKDSEEYLYLVEAAKCVPLAYHVSELATIFVRCPYGANPYQYDDDGEEKDPWNDRVAVDSLDSGNGDYETTANVYQPGTVQVMAKISADGSLLVLCGSSHVRYKRNSHDGSEASWKTLADHDTIGSVTSFGTIMYIDGDANEKEYSLDEIFEVAMSTRETYCSSVISTAAGLMAMRVLDKNNGTPRVGHGGGGLSTSDWSSPRVVDANGVTTTTAPTDTTSSSTALSQPPVMVDQAVGSYMILESVDSCVGTDDLPFTTTTREQSNEGNPVQVADACVGTEEPWPNADDDPNQNIDNTGVQTKRVATADACVGTEVEFQLEAAAAAGGGGGAVNGEGRAAAEGATPSTSLVGKNKDEEQQYTHDQLSFLLWYGFSSLLALVMFVSIRVPYRFLKFMFWALVIWILYTGAWLYFADDHGAETIMGATPLPFYNGYGIV